MQTIDDWHEIVDQSEKISVCIYCGAENLTKEHIFPKWLSKIINMKGGSALDVGSSYPIDNSMLFKRKELIELIYQTTKNKAGSVINWQPKIVCATCNNGWMSRLQENAKSILMSALSKFPNIETDSITISKWAIMFSISSEYFNAGEKVIAPSEKSKFMTDEEISPAWSIWAGRFHGAYRGFNYRSRSLKIHTTADSFGLIVGIHTTAKTIGSLLLMVIYNKIPELRSEDWKYVWHKGLQRLFPEIPKYTGNPLVSYTDSAFEKLADHPVFKTAERLNLVE